MANTDALTDIGTDEQSGTTIVMGDALTDGGGGSGYEPPTTGQLYPTGTEQD